MKRPATILVVEDDDAVRRFTLMALNAHGYQTLEAIDGRTGLDAFLRHRDKITLILTDILMPEPGPEMALRILAADPQAHILFMSGTVGFNELPPQLANLPMLQKPFTTERLLDAIRTSLQ